MALAAQLPVGRVLVNQAHALNNGGSVANGLNFSLSIGCGTWARNISTENLSWRNFVNVTQLVEPIPAVELHPEALFSSFFARHGR
jgi:sulfoacetaldehyde dehydrogenase